MPKVVITMPDGEKVPHELSGPSITLGRNEENTIPLEEGSISGSHAEFVESDGSYLLRDLDSTNGTSVNGEAASDTLLKSGDSILFGNVPARFESADASGGAAQEEQEEEVALGEAEEIAADLGSSSARPSEFSSISPFSTKKKKKDALGSLAIALGLLGIIACIGVAIFATVMRAT